MPMNSSAYFRSCRLTDDRRTEVARLPPPPTEWNYPARKTGATNTVYYDDPPCPRKLAKRARTSLRLDFIDVIMLQPKPGE